MTVCMTCKRCIIPAGIIVIYMEINYRNVLFRIPRIGILHVDALDLNLKKKSLEKTWEQMGI